MSKTTTQPQTAEDLLRAAGLKFNRLEDVPPAAVRAVNRRGFRDMRSTILPPQIIRDALRQPLLGELLITRIGHATRLAGHYIPRPEGSLDHILILCPQGAGWLKMGGREWNVGPATMLCLPANVPHWYGANERDPWSNYWIHFSGRQASEYFRFLDVAADRPLLHFADYDAIIASFEEMWSTMKLVHVWENLVRGSICLTRMFGLLRDRQQRPDQRARDRVEAVAKTARFMTANLAAELSLAELADLAGMSVSRYTVEFRNRNGCSPMEFLGRLRIQRACELLRVSGKTVRQIAAEVGFSDQYYFSRAFKKLAGCSPQAFRKGGGGSRGTIAPQP